VLAATTHLFFERSLEILDVYFGIEGAAAKGVGDFDLFYVIHTKQVRNGVEDSLA
jgi:hypothetical protein